MLKLALFGHPVSHSLSPRIHALFAKQCGIEIDYRAIDCPAGDLDAALQAFRIGGGSGCNLTVPLKSEGLALAAEISPQSRDAGACNTLVWRGAGWFADNTDGAGLIADLDRLGVTVANRRVLILGAGGAVAGTLGPLLERKPAEVRVMNRSLDRAHRLAARFSGRGAAVHACSPSGVESSPDFDLVIQGTSLGHQGRCPTIQPEWLAPDAVGYDLNYGPAFAPFAQRCAALGMACHSGLGMLIEQAALAFQRFTGELPVTRRVHRAFDHSPD
jgi:shikimate dehydrogenase